MAELERVAKVVFGVYVRELEAALAELVEKAEAVLEYARHVPGCAFNLGRKHHNEICQCGLIKRLPQIRGALTKAKELLPKERSGCDASAPASRERNPATGAATAGAANASRSPGGATPEGTARREGGRG